MEVIYMSRKLVRVSWRNLHLAKPINYVDVINSYWETDIKSSSLKLDCNDEVVVSNVFENNNNISFESINKGEKILREEFDSLTSYPDFEKIVRAVLLLDCIYHTRLKDPMRVSISLDEKIVDKEWIKYIKGMDRKSSIEERAYIINSITEIDKNDIKNGQFIYSFATKFCNWLNPSAFPIMDKYVSCLLSKYMKKPKNSFGSSAYFIKIYNQFVEDYGLEDFNYKQIDQALWIYGKLIDKKHLVDNKIVAWDSVQYKKPKQNEM
jgi:hypothetical protein